jgi:hypothetical protein
MANENVKRTISMAVWGLGILGSLLGCLAYVGMMFCAGASDSPQEVRAITFAAMTPLPACILALWKRMYAGVWLVFAGAYLIYGMLVQRAFMIKVSCCGNQSSVLQTLKFGLLMAAPLLALGTFGIVTDLLKWPSVFKRQSCFPIEE